MYFFKRRSLLSVLLCFSPFVLSVAVLAQTPPTDLNLDTGMKPYETFDRAQENVNIAAGNLNVEIPLIHLPGRNGHDFTLSLAYNSQNWTPVASPGNGYSQNGSVPITTSSYIAWEYAQPGTNGESLGTTGWQLNIPVLYATGVTTPPACASWNNGCYGQSSATQSSQYTNFFVVMGDGTKYQFPYASFLNWLTTYTYPAPDNPDLEYIFTQPEPSEDFLIDYDLNGKYAGSFGQGVMLDLTNAANGTGTAVVRFRDGSQIQFNIDPGGFTQPVIDGSNVSPATANPSVWAPASALVDPNGNVIDGFPATPTGSTGAGIVPVGSPNLSQCKGQTGAQYQYMNSNGQPQTVTLCLSPQFPNVPPTWQTPAAGQEGVVSVSSGQIINMLSSVFLPDGLTYTFQYNQYGELTEITYPSGGYTRYKYAAIPNANYYEWTAAMTGGADRRVVVEKDTCPGQSTASLQSGYYGTSTPPNTCSVPEETTTYNNWAVVDPMGNETDYMFGGATCGVAPSATNTSGFLNFGYGVPTMELSRQVYQGPASSGKLLRAVFSNYYSGCQPDMKTSEMTVLPNGSWSETTWSYDTAPNIYYTPAITDHDGSVQSLASGETNNILVKSEYGFGPGPAPAPPSSTGNPVAPNLPLLRQTVNSYMATNPVNAVDYQQVPVYILNRLQQQTVYNGSGAQVAQTTYTYDSYTSGLAPTGAVQHGTPLNSYGVGYTTRGNVTQVSKWAGSGTPPVTASYQYDDAGNVLTKTDALGYSTRYSFADVWANSTCKPSGGPSAAFPTSITNAAGQTTSYTWNSCSGTMASITDPNKQTISFAYDSMDRRIRANYPDGGWTSLQYSDDSSTTLPIEITETKAINSGTNEVSTILLDGLSRVSQTQTVDPDNGSGFDTVLTTYDLAGNVYCVTNPFSSTSDATYGQTCYQYDALHRKVIQTQQDGSTLQWCYDGVKVNSQQSSSLCAQNLGTQWGDWVDSMDENSNHWQRTSDALGRLVEVMEPNGAPSSSGGSQTPTLETDYSYNALDDLIGVYQRGNGAADTPRMRSFTYDGLSRLLCASNPENSFASCPAAYSQYVPGTTGYSYDPDSNLPAKNEMPNPETTTSKRATTAAPWGVS
jgi:YD repeat-containing protein